MRKVASFKQFLNTKNLSIFYYVENNELNALVANDTPYYKAKFNNFFHLYRNTMLTEFTGVYIGCLKFEHSTNVHLWDNPILDLSHPKNIYYVCPQTFINL